MSKGTQQQRTSIKDRAWELYARQVRVAAVQGITNEGLAQKCFEAVLAFDSVSEKPREE